MVQCDSFPALELCYGSLKQIGLSFGSSPKDGEAQVFGLLAQRGDVETVTKLLAKTVWSVRGEGHPRFTVIEELARSFVVGVKDFENLVALCLVCLCKKDCVIREEEMGNVETAWP